MSLQGDKAHDYQQKWVERMVQTIIKRLAPFSLSKPATITDKLQDLFELSLELDQEIHRQVAMVTWDFGAQLPSPFDPTYMVLEAGSQQNDNELVATLVLAPGLYRRGRASGDRFDEITTLLNMVVSCERPVCSVSNGRPRAGTGIKQIIQTWYS